MLILYNINKKYCFPHILSNISKKSGRKSPRIGFSSRFFTVSFWSIHGIIIGVVLFADHVFHTVDDVNAGPQAGADVSPLSVAEQHVTGGSINGDKFFGVDFNLHYR